MGRTFKAVVVALYGLLVAVLAAATFVEQARGTAFVEEHVYHAYWFCGLWGALAVAVVVACVRYRGWRARFPALLLHGSFLVILAGALLTFATGKRGHVYLAAGGTADSFVEQGSGLPQPLPFTVGLDSFRVEYYPGTKAPADYVSHVRFRPHGEDAAAVPAIISMNRIGVYRGFRFYQSSYDGKGGSWLTVNHDPWGIGVTYAGYCLLGLSMLWLLFARGGGFRRLLRNPLLRRGGLAGVLLCVAVGAGAQGRSLPVLPRDRADSLARVQVVYRDRVAPFNTLARDFVLKLTGKPAYGNLTPEQVVSGWLLRPEVWKDEPMIRIKNESLRRLLGLSGSRASLSDLFNGQEYRLQGLARQASPRPGREQAALEKALVEVDEKVGLILMLCNGTLVRPLPADGSVPALSPARVEAELLYNRVPFVRLLSMGCLALGALAFARLLCGGWRGARRDRGGSACRAPGCRRGCMRHSCSTPSVTGCGGTWPGASRWATATRRCCSWRSARWGQPACCAGVSRRCCLSGCWRQASRCWWRDWGSVTRRLRRSCPCSCLPGLARMCRSSCWPMPCWPSSCWAGCWACACRRRPGG